MFRRQDLFQSVPDGCIIFDDEDALHAERLPVCAVYGGTEE